MPIINRFARVLAVLFVCVGIATPAHAQLEQIIQQIESTGQARVIVRMKEAAQDLAWQNAKSTAAQRAAVRTMRQSLDTALAAQDLVVEQSFSSLPFVGVRLDRERLGALLAMSEVAAVFPVIIERKVQSKEGPRLASSIPSIDVSDAWARGYEGEGFTVAVIDGGFDTDHAMLSGKTVGDACFSATFGLDTFSQCPGGITPQIGPGSASYCPSGSDRCDHGTHVASTAVGNDGTSFGIARAAQFMPIDVFSQVTDEDECSPDPAPCELTDSLAVLDALNYINENAELHNVVSVNISLGGGQNSGPCDDDPRKVVVDMLREKGVATAAAAGNEGLNGEINSPACISSVLAVGATNDGTTIPSFSNFASFMDVMAPGVSIRAAKAGGGLVSRSGTSMATPHVAGAFAVVRSAFPEATVDEITNAMKTSGIDVTRANQNFSLPRIQVNQTILSLQGVNVRVFNNVIGSRTTDVGQSLVRLHNTTDEEGRVRMSLRDSETGARLGRWVSPIIPAHASFQFNVDRLETEAVAEQVIATDERTYYNLVVEAEFRGSMQHVLWQRSAGVLSNMTSCADGIVGGERALFNVHSSLIPEYPSSIRIYNSGTTRSRATLNVYGSTSGEDLGTWTSDIIEAGAAVEVSVDDISADFEYAPVTDNILADAVNTLPSHLNIEMRDGFTGHLQHTVRNVAANVLTDMSAKCALGPGD